MTLVSVHLLNEGCQINGIIPSQCIRAAIFLLHAVQNFHRK